MRELCYLEAQVVVIYREYLEPDMRATGVQTGIAYGQRRTSIRNPDHGVP